MLSKSIRVIFDRPEEAAGGILNSNWQYASEKENDLDVYLFANGCKNVVLNVTVLKFDYSRVIVSFDSDTFSITNESVIGGMYFFYLICNKIHF